MVSVPDNTDGPVAPALPLGPVLISCLAACVRVEGHPADS